MAEYGNLESIASGIRASRHIVCLFGRRAAGDCGCFNYQISEDVYYVERKYGYSPEEILSASIYNTRPKLFFDFYKNMFLERIGEPGEALRVLKRLEDDGRLLATITRSLYGLPGRAGLTRVVNMHGSIYENKCPRCGTMYDLEFMRSAKELPICPKCGTIVRPQIVLDGEMIPNEKITSAANYVTHADTLLVLGSTLRTTLVGGAIKYFSGNRIILINDEEDYSDSVADLVYHGKPRDVLPKLCL